MSSENIVSISEDKRKGRRKIVLFLLLGGILSGGVYYIWYIVQKPSIGTIKTGALPAEPESFAQNSEKKLYKGKYIIFAYPGSYNEKSHDAPKEGPVKEQIVLFGDESQGKRIAFVVEDRSDKYLDASPAFQMRMKDKEQYEKEIIGTGRDQKVIFTKNSQVFETTAFFMKKNLLVSVSVTSPIHLDGLRDDLLKILETL